MRNSSSPSALLVWWSTNTRAASVVIQRALELGIVVVVVVDPHAPELGDRAKKDAFIIQREKSYFELLEFESVLDTARNISGAKRIVFAPTTEYMLHSISTSERSLSNFEVPIKSLYPYDRMSSKAFQGDYFEENFPEYAPNRIPGPGCRNNFYAKPRNNFSGEVALRPFLVDNEESRRDFLAVSDLYFAQEILSPPSLYWCGYRSSSGEITRYLQRNLLQEQQGGSIVVAQVEDINQHSALDRVCKKYLQDCEHFGPAMFEFRGNSPKLVEINPRFWGPLLLDLISGSGVLDAFFEDWFETKNQDEASLFEEFNGIYLVPKAFRAFSSLVKLQDYDDVELTFASEVFYKLGGDWC